MKTTSLRLSEMDIETATEIGRGNLSAGIRTALAVYRIMRRLAEEEPDRPVSGLARTAEMMAGGDQ